MGQPVQQDVDAVDHQIALFNPETRIRPAIPGLEVVDEVLHRQQEPDAAREEEPAQRAIHGVISRLRSQGLPDRLLRLLHRRSRWLLLRRRLLVRFRSRVHLLQGSGKRRLRRLVPPA